MEENLSLKLEEGEIFGFIGPNGAGKSTTIRYIMNLINKTSGKILIKGKEFNNKKEEHQMMFFFFVVNFPNSN